MSAPALVAALLGGLAVLLVQPRLPIARRRLGASRPFVVVLVVAALAGLPFLVSWRMVAVVVIVAGTVAGVLHLVHRHRRHTVAEAHREAVVEACQAMAADLQAGSTPRAALGRAAADFALLAPAAAAAEVDADVPEALRIVAGQPGCAELRLVAAAWQVTHRAGAGLAPALSTTAATLRERRATTRLVSSELASARATGWLMAILPVVVILLGSGLGGDPVHFLTGTTVGLGCLGIGLALTLAGWVWIDRLAAAVIRS